MATIVNTTPAVTGSSDNGMGFLLGVLLLIVFVGVILYFSIPYIQQSVSGGGAQINVPNQVKVHVKTTK